MGLLLARFVFAFGDVTAVAAAAFFDAAVLAVLAVLASLVVHAAADRLD